MRIAANAHGAGFHGTSGPIAQARNTRIAKIQREALRDNALPDSALPELALARFSVR